MLHPFMPFVTEELWNAIPRPYELIVAKWPKPEATLDSEAAQEVRSLIELVDAVRTMRAELNIPWSKKLDAEVIGGDAQVTTFMQKHAQTLDRMAKIGAVLPAESVSLGSAQIAVDEVTVAFPLAGIIALDQEIDRLTKAYAAAMKEHGSLAARLANPNFTERAKPEAIEKARSDHAAKSAEAERLRAALERLG
jgi:valyl-tRNA synthetase